MQNTLCGLPQVLLARYCRVEDIVVGTPLANRSQAELESVIGYFVNVAALRADLSGMPYNMNNWPSHTLADESVHVHVAVLSNHVRSCEIQTM